jgi:hypothetical protein
MRNLLLKLLVLAATALPIVTHADILDATLIDGSHIFTFTLPSPYTFPDQLHLVTIPTIATTGTADGVSGKTFDVTFYTGIGTGGQSVFIDELGGTQYLLYGPVLVSPSLQPGAPGTDTALIHTGSFTLLDFALSSAAGPYYVNLTITPQSTTPEPSSFTLLATGTLGIASFAARRRSDRQVLS